MADQEIPIRGLSFLPIMFSIHDPNQNNQSHQILFLNPLILNQLAQDPAGPRPASKASIEALKTISVEENKSYEEGIECECVVCLEGLFEKEDAVVKEMPCGHRYHGECIERWLKMHGSCPVCRYCMPEEEKEEKKTPTERSEEGRLGVWVSFMFGMMNGRDDASRTD